jgi:hypothetical protein
MAVPVNIFVTDDSVSPAAIQGVVVNAYDPSTLSLIASATSDSAGRAAFSLPGNVSPGTTYEVRFFKLGVIFANPMQIQVIEPVVTNNNFDMSGTLLTLEVATDPDCCRCTGRLLDFSNRPLVNILVRIMAQADLRGQIPKVVNGNLISAEAMNLRTDINGFIKVDLLRGGQYWVMYSGEDDNVTPITVPDRTSANLIDLMYPQPVSFAWDPAVAPGNAITITHGLSAEVGGTITFSDFTSKTIELALYLDFTSANPTVASIGDTGNTVTINAQSPGVTTISVTVASGLSPSRIPNYSISAPNLTVTVG